MCMKIKAEPCLHTDVPIRPLSWQPVRGMWKSESGTVRPLPQPILFDNHGPDTRYTGPVEVAQTITSALGTGGNNTPLAVNKEPFCIAGNIINRKEKNGGNGCGYQQGISYTLTTEDRHCVFAPENDRKSVCRG